MLEPAVSVFIPTFNRLPRLKKAVQSVLSQGDFIQLHVLDNASTDGTSAWLHELRNNNPRVQLTLRTTNVGATKNFIDGFEAVQTPYLVPLADDDELAPNFLNVALGFLKSDSTLTAAVFRTELRRNRSAVAFSPSETMNRRLDHKAHLLEWSTKGHYVSWSSILWKTEVILKHIRAGEFGRFGLPSDIWIQFLVFCEASVQVSNNVGSIFNLHEEQVSRGVGPHSVSDFGELLSAMNAHLESSIAMSTDEKKTFLRNIGLHFNRILGDHAKNINLLPEDGDFRDWIECYLKYLYPYVGFKEFPFVTLFEEHKSLISQFEALEHRSSTRTGNLRYTARILPQWLISRFRILLGANQIS
jgi:glycosyltransferase involved in cell wall biosynthesis